MLTATVGAACEHGAANVTVAHVVERAGVSRRTFYEIFDDSQDCLLAALDDAIAHASERVLTAYAAAAAGRWRERLRSALTALLQFLDEEPGMGRLLIVETLAAGRPALERRSRVLDRLIAAVEAGSRESSATLGTTRLTAEGVVGAVLSVIHSRLLEERGGERLIALVNPLMSMIVLPYLGAAAARRELGRPVVPLTRRAGTPSGNPLKDLHMRLTYRTVWVLASVAANPASSNRMIGDAAGISDQGQISKLLARLGKLGLIENAHASSARGEPNAWTLTKRGKAVHAALGVQRG